MGSSSGNEVRGGGDFDDRVTVLGEGRVQRLAAVMCKGNAVFTLRGTQGNLCRQQNGCDSWCQQAVSTSLMPSGR